MRHGDVRHCDVCGAVIQRDTPYRAGWATPAAVASAFEEGAAPHPTFAREADGTVRFDVCGRCVAECPELATVTSEAVDRVS